jgi:Protein of unknown function (DUF3168)
MIDQDLLTELQQLGTGAGARVYLDTVPQNVALPAIVLRRNGGERPRTLNGTPLFERSTFEVNVIAREHAQTYSVMKAIRDRLDGYKGPMGATNVRDARCVLFPDHQSQVTGDSVTRLVTAQFRFMHSEV